MNPTDQGRDVADRPAVDVSAEARAVANRRRRRLLLRSVPVLLLLLLFSIKTLSMVAVNESGRGAYAGGDHAGAESRFARLEVLNLFQWWIAPYNRGTASYQAGNLDPAVEQLDIALGRAPQDKKCQVATNLARVNEAQGDQFASQGRHGDAQERYKAALQVIAEHRCGGSQEGESDQQQKEQQEKQKQAEERVGKKLDESESQPEGEPSEEEGDPQQQPERTPQEEQRRSEEQKKRNGEGQRQEQDRREMEDAESEPDRERVDKPW